MSLSILKVIVMPKNFSAGKYIIHLNNLPQLVTPKEYVQVYSVYSLWSVAGLVLQATGRTEFEDGLRPGSPGGVMSDNPSVRTSSLVTLVL